MLKSVFESDVRQELYLCWNLKKDSYNVRTFQCPTCENIFKLREYSNLGISNVNKILYVSKHTQGMIYHLMIERERYSVSCEKMQHDNVCSRINYPISRSALIFGWYHKLEHHSLERHVLLTLLFTPTILFKKPTSLAWQGRLAVVRWKNKGFPCAAASP